jgi:hypothetical protein
VLASSWDYEHEAYFSSIPNSNVLPCVRGDLHVRHFGQRMKTKTTQLIQHLSHEIEDEEKAEAYLDESLPLIGLVVMYFNALEKDLDSILCQTVTDRTDVPGLIIIQKLSYGAKVDLFKRFCDDFHLCGLGVINGFGRLINGLTEVGRLRNLVVHADWESTDHEGYTFVRLKTSAKGLEQEYVQFSAESLEKLTGQILSLRNDLFDFWGRRNDVLYGHHA